MPTDIATQPKRNLFSVNYSLVDYETASDILIAHARINNSYGLSALAGSPHSQAMPFHNPVTGGP